MITNKKIYIIGPPGSGKTTLASKIAEELRCNHIDLDWIRYPSVGKMLSDVEVKKEISELVKQNCWAMEGIYIYWNREVLEKADQIIWLDVPFHKALYRIAKRYLRNLATGQDKHGFISFLKLVKNLTRYYFSNYPESQKDEDVTREKTKQVLEEYKSKVVRL